MMKFLYLTFFLFTICVAEAATLDYWPHSKWKTKDPEQAGLSYLKLHEAQKYVFSKKDKFNSNVFLIVKDGHLIFEKYANGYAYNKPHRLWSIAKSVTSALVGVALQEQKLRLRDQVATTHPELAKDPKKSRITIANLLQMSSGINWNEGYENNVFSSDIISALYTDKFNDIADYVSKKKAKCLPDSCFNYSSGDTNLLMSHLKKTLGKNNYDLYPWTHFFYKIGVHSATWEQDLSGTFVGSSFLYMTARDLAKIGLLYLSQGRTEKEQILPSRYIHWSLQLAPSFNKTKLEGEANKESYGGHWWLNLELPRKEQPRAFADAPEQMFLARGHHGQVMAVIPNHNMVIVRLGADKEGKIDINKMVSLVIKAMEREPIKK